ncbi:hypothetical protein L3X38_017634 [Prunus dulcis]|uniref:RNase H type-1 domain-containing protein n=1 Tax=Prunus dulcis TaxID=3755 RepID=A0AAD4ZAW9_PRUDU|nr:hypothetical protein L3X38_017634 [Prunus dulcis]
MWLKVLFFEMVLLLPLIEVGVKLWLKVTLTCYRQCPRKVHPPWSIQQIIQDIWLLNSSAVYVCFQHVFREANFMANAVAKLNHGLSSQVCWELGLPLSICSPFYFDLFGHSCPRGFVL